MIPRIYAMTFIKEPCPNLYHKCLPNLAWKMLRAKMPLPVWVTANRTCFLGIMLLENLPIFLPKLWWKWVIFCLLFYIKTSVVKKLKPSATELAWKVEELWGCMHISHWLKYFTLVIILSRWNLTRRQQCSSMLFLPPFLQKVKKAIINFLPALQL